MPQPLTPEEQSTARRARLVRAVRASALERLVANHEEEFRQLVRDETNKLREVLGLPAMEEASPSPTASS